MNRAQAMRSRYGSRNVSTRVRAPQNRPAPEGAALVPSVSVNRPETQAFGSVSQVGNSDQLSYFSLTMDNSSSADLDYIIGDPNQVIAGAAKATTWQAPVSNTIPYAALLATLATGRLQIAMINYEVETSAAQFNKAFKFVKADVDGSFSSRPVGVGNAKRNNQFNPKLLTLTFPRLILNLFEGLLLTVTAGEKVTMDFEVGASANRAS